VDIVRGTVVHCSRFGAVVRLEDGRLAWVPSEEQGISAIRRAMTGGRKPAFPFAVTEDTGRRVRLALLDEHESGERVDPALAQRGIAHAQRSLEQKIIDYLRQTSEWDTRPSDAPRHEEMPRADRLLPFELRARRQYRDSPQRPKRSKRR
jgi:hypothetical protein